MDLQGLLDLARTNTKSAHDAALAKRMGVTRGALSNWRTGQRFPDWDGCELIAKAAGLPLVEVLGIVAKSRSRFAGGETDPDPSQLPLPGLARGLAA